MSTQDVVLARRHQINTCRKRICASCPSMLSWNVPATNCRDHTLSTLVVPTEKSISPNSEQQPKSDLAIDEGQRYRAIFDCRLGVFAFRVSSESGAVGASVHFQSIPTQLTSTIPEVVASWPSELTKRSASLRNWEMAIKSSLRRLTLPARASDYITDKVQRGLQVLAIDWSVAAAADRPTRHASEPRKGESRPRNHQVALLWKSAAEDEGH